MADFFPPDDGDGAPSPSDSQVEACFTVHGQLRVNRLFGVPRMSRTINPTAEGVNREDPAVEAQSEGNGSSPGIGGASYPHTSDVSHIQLSFKPLTVESQVKNMTEEEMEEGVDVSTSTEQEPSEENSGYEAATGTRIPPQASEEEAAVVDLSPEKELTALPEAPEKEGKEEEEAPALDMAAEKQPVVPQLAEEAAVPLSVPHKEQKATPLQLGEEPSVPQLLPENEETIPQLPPETETLSGLPLGMEPSVPQPLPQKDQSVPHLPQETEPSVPQPLPESEQNVPQLPSLPQAAEMEPPVPLPQIFKEPLVPQTPAETEPPFPPQPAEMEPKAPHPQVFEEPPVPQTPVQVEPPIPQPLKERPVPPLPPMSEPIAPRSPAIKEFLALQSLPEKSVAAKDHIALRETSPYRFERHAFQEERETVIHSETKAWPGREDTSASVPAYPKPKPAAAPPGGKYVSLSDTVEDLTSHLREVGSASKSTMASSISSFVASPVGKVFANTIDRALEKSEEWLDYYFPVLEPENESSTTAEEEPSTTSKDLSKEGCFMRISSLSTKLRSRAFHLALQQLKTTRQAAKENLPVLDQILEVLDRAPGQNLLNIASIPESVHNLWAQKGLKQEPPRSKKTSWMSQKKTPSIVPEQLEIKALDLTRTLAKQLYGTYHDLLPHVPDLPRHLQDNVIRVYENMEELQGHFSSSSSLRDLPSTIVIQSRQKMAAARENLDEILDFLAQNSTVTWLSQTPSSSKGKQPTSAAAEREPRGRSPDRKAMEENSTSNQPPSLPHL